MMLTPLQLLYVHPNPSCDGCARDVEENRMRKKTWKKKKKRPVMDVHVMLKRIECEKKDGRENEKNKKRLA